MNTVLWRLLAADGKEISQRDLNSNHRSGKPMMVVVTVALLKSYLSFAAAWNFKSSMAVLRWLCFDSDLNPYSD